MKTKTDVKTLFNSGREMLRAAGNPSAGFDTACLLEHFTGLSRANVIATPDRCVDGDGFLDACKLRATGYPLQYILGHWEFMGIDFLLTPDVLIPRADTETLVEYILREYSGDVRVLDMCCGSGCIGLSIKFFLPEAHVTLCDISDAALDVTKKNAALLGLSVDIKKADLTKGGDSYFERESFDIIVSNPPYIKTCDMPFLDKEVTHEPYIALCGGEDGTDFYRALIDSWEYQLRVGGEMILEAGYDTAKSIELLFIECGFADITSRRDAGGITRLISAKRGLHK